MGSRCLCDEEGYVARVHVESARHHTIPIIPAEQISMCEGFWTESQGRTQALTVSNVPKSLDSGTPASSLHVTTQYRSYLPSKQETF